MWKKVKSSNKQHWAELQRLERTFVFDSVVKLTLQISIEGTF